MGLDGAYAFPVPVAATVLPTSGKVGVRVVDLSGLPVDTYLYVAVFC